MANPSLPARTFRDYIAYARANPSKINYGTIGVGGIQHLAGAWMHGSTNTTVTFVAYKGTGSVVSDLTSGRLDVAPAALMAALPLIKAGKVRVLAILNAQRHRFLPDVPTIAEQGIPDYDYKNWMGILAPRGTPQPIIRSLSAAFSKVATSPDVASALEAEGSLMIGSTPEQFRNLIQAESARWKNVVVKAGIKTQE